MIRVCAWCDQEKDEKGETIGHVMGCKTDNNEYDCVTCDCAHECRVRIDWPKYTSEQRVNCSATHGLCKAAMEKHHQPKS
jgi:hypothetical protein